ncbi:MAG: glycoside hydrolase family 19 protein [Sediminibacterium sp.]
MLNQTQINNANSLKSEMNNKGITNPYVQTAILGVVLKESGFNPSSKEVSYAGTSNSRIRSIFSKTKSLTDAELNSLKADKTKFFDFVYSHLGGSKYIGRGYNQLTGIDNYRFYGNKIGVDLVSKPDLVSTPTIANKVLIEYMKQGIDTLKRVGKFSGKDINDFKDQKSAYNAIYNINAGAGKNLYDANGNIKSDTTGGYKTGSDSLAWISKNITGLKDAIIDKSKEGAEIVKKNFVPTILITTALLVGSVILYKTLKQK